MSHEAGAASAPSGFALQLDVSVEDELGVAVPNAAQLQGWAQAVLAEFVEQPIDLSVLICGAEQGRALNHQYRERDYATNVLSFPAVNDLHELKAHGLLGDLAFCAPVIEREAEEQGKHWLDHWAHLMIHGCLHLLGHDHIDDQEADVMEALEIDILARLGIANPYLSSAEPDPGVGQRQGDSQA